MGNVEKMWISLRESLWESCGKVLHSTRKSWFCTKKWAKVGVFHGGVEKFYSMICTWFYRDRMGFYTVSTAHTTITTNIL